MRSRLLGALLALTLPVAAGGCVDGASSTGSAGTSSSQSLTATVPATATSVEGGGSTTATTGTIPGGGGAPEVTCPVNRTSGKPVANGCFWQVSPTTGSGALPGVPRVGSYDGRLGCRWRRASAGAQPGYVTFTCR